MNKTILLFVILMVYASASRRKEPINVPITEPEPYSAYYQKYAELAAEYGEAKLVDVGEDGEECSYLEGVCVVGLMDFNGDGVKELLTIYSNGNYTGKNTNEMAIPQSGTYEMDIWTYQYGTVTPLLREPQVGFFYSYDMEGYWDTDNCFVTIYENEKGLPIIQLYGENEGACTYTNLYYSEGTMTKDEFSYSEASFTRNGTDITEDVWNENVTAYDSFLFGAYLSSDGFSSEALLECSAIDYADTLNQTKQVVEALSQGRPFEWKEANEGYIPLYRKELERFNRGRFENVKEYGIGRPYDYCIYDLDQNGVPELVIRTGNCEADYMFHIYTVVSGKLVDCGKVTGSHSELHTDGSRGMIRYEAHMGWYSISKITLDGTAIKEEEVKTGEVEGGEDYPTLDEFGYGGYEEALVFCYGTVPFALYPVNANGTSHLDTTKQSMKPKNLEEAYQTILDGDFSLIEDEDDRETLESLYSLSMDDEEDELWRYVRMDFNGDSLDELFIKLSSAYDSALLAYKDGKVEVVYIDCVETTCYIRPLKDGKLFEVYDYWLWPTQTIYSLDSENHFIVEEAYSSIEIPDPDSYKELKEYFEKILIKHPFMKVGGNYYFYQEYKDGKDYGEKHHLSNKEWRQAQEGIEGRLLSKSEWNTFSR